MGRQHIYNAIGDQYEKDRYGAAHMESYCRQRNEAISGIIDKVFGFDAPLAILEIGCGTGLTLEHLAQKSVAYRLCGVDFSKTMLDQARQKANVLERPPQLMLGSASCLPFANKSFDVVLATRFIHQFKHENKKKIYREIFRVVQLGGIVIVEFYARLYHHLRYFLGGGKGKSSQDYFSHYPTKSQVRDIVGGPFEIRPVRVGGARIIHAIFGNRLLQAVTRASSFPPLNLLVDEYLVVARK